MLHASHAAAPISPQLAAQLSLSTSLDSLATPVAVSSLGSTPGLAGESLASVAVPPAASMAPSAAWSSLDTSVLAFGLVGIWMILVGCAAFARQLRRLAVSTHAMPSQLPLKATA